MDKNYIVKKSNYFIMNCSYDLSLEEQKLILTLASMVQPEDEDFKPYKFKISDFMCLLGVDTKTKYTEIPKITKELMKKVFEIEDGDILIQTAWLSSATYKKGTGLVELEFSPRLKPYMIKLNGLFTQYKLGNILSMKSKYSPRIYEILKCNEFKRQGYIEIEIDDLRKLLKAENIYPKYNDFKRKIIEQTQKELSKLSDIYFDFEEIKTGRKVTSIRFFIKSKIPTRKSTSEDEVAATRFNNNNTDIDRVMAIVRVITNKEISEKSAKDIYKSATENKEYGNDPLRLIEEVAEYSKTQNIKAVVGWLKTTLRDYERPLQKSKKDNFNNFEQRQYDFDDLEMKLLGWDKK